jgi:hypothetical protein
LLKTVKKIGARLVVVQIISLEILGNWWYRVFLCAEFEYLIRILISSILPLIFTNYYLKKIGARLVVHIISLEILKNWWYRVLLCAEFKYLIRILISSVVPLIFINYCSKKIGARLVVEQIISLEILVNWWYRVFLCAEFKYLIRILISSMVPLIFTNYCLKTVKKDRG